MLYTNEPIDPYTGIVEGGTGAILLHQYLPPRTL